MSLNAAITLKQLRAFAMVIEAGNLTAAAGRMNVTTPAVSAQLKALEQNLDAKLMHRGADGRIELTAPGEVLLASVSEVEAVLERSFRRIKALNAGKEGHVVLGAVSTAKYFAPALFARIREALPEIEMELKIGNREDTIAGLAAHRLDLAIMGRPPHEPAVAARVIGDHPQVMIAPPGHPLAGAGRAEAERLLAETFLFREPGSGTRLLMEKVLDDLGGGMPYKSVELDSNETIKQAVMAGLGIALISAHTVIAELATGRLATIRMPGKPIVRQWFLVSPKDRPLTPAAAHLHAFLTDLDGDFLPPVRLPGAGGKAPRPTKRRGRLQSTPERP